MVHRITTINSIWMSLLSVSSAAVIACSDGAPQGVVPPATSMANAMPAAGAAPTAAPPTAVAMGNTPAAMGNGAVPAPPVGNPSLPPPVAGGSATPVDPGAAGAGAVTEVPFMEPVYEDGPLEGSCPDGFTPRMGMNSGFVSDEKEREFLVYLPSDMSTPRPVFVGITGTEEQSNAFISATGLNNLTQEGWIVLAPVRRCTTEGRQQECLNGVGESTMDGWVWEPWNDGSQEDKWNTDEGPDVRFLENMVKCVAAEWPVDNRRIYLGGISAGGSFTNRNLAYNSDFWAGGSPASGMWYVIGGPDAVTEETADDLLDGYCCPRPATGIKMYSSIAIVLFGGPRDTYTTRDGQLVEYKPEAQIASNVYDAQDNVAVVTCEGTQGHIWPRSAAWNSWMAKTLASHPKGTPKAEFKLETPPAGFTCNVGRYTNLTF
jgi:hypothetical protein